jgi:hypothetical protein
LATMTDAEANEKFRDRTRDEHGSCVCVNCQYWGTACLLKEAREAQHAQVLCNLAFADTWNDLFKERCRFRDALVDVRAGIKANAADTLWMPGTAAQTVVDVINEALREQE